jgi:hypothetical protein
MFILKQELYKESNICVRTEASTLVSATVMESSPQVDSPTMFKRQLASQYASTSLKPILKQNVNNIFCNVPELKQYL